ncbi:MAG: CbtB-domain containing protein [Hyphomicrobiales bacterium]|nr:CbtB-domain containing protein [Hyphomicrobiales bacterium]
MRIKVVDKINYFLLKDADIFSSVMAVVLGISLVIVFGLASPDFIHNAAHDVRHAMTFPCH